MGFQRRITLHCIMVGLNGGIRMGRYLTYNTLRNEHECTIPLYAAFGSIPSILDDP